MELKQKQQTTASNWEKLLIVPYGIETAKHLVRLLRVSLLIVPYGIETMCGYAVCS